MPHERFAASPGRAVARDVDGVNAPEPLGLLVAPALPAAAVDRLPRGELGVPELDEDPFWRLVAAFLVECRRAQTRRAYFTDLKAWYAWCTERERHPLAARRHDVALWTRQLAEQPRASGKAAAPASIARRLACLSSFYGYGVEVGVLDENPVTNVKRPRVANDSMSVGLTREELERLLQAAEADGLRSAALVTLLPTTACASTRHSHATSSTSATSSATACCASRARAGATCSSPSPPVERALDSHLAERTTGPLFIDDRGRRMYEAQAWRLVRRLARRAGLKAAGQLSPHSLRHTFATSLDAAGVALQDIQDAMGHADPRTTRRYMATHQHLDRHAAYAFAAWLRRALDPPQPAD